MVRDLIAEHAQPVLAFGGLLIGFLFGAVVAGAFLGLRLLERSLGAA